MAQSLLANLADLERYVQVAYYEEIAEKYAYFNANSNGAITLVNASVQGETPTNGFFAVNTSNGGRRDTTASSAYTLAGLVQSTFKSIVLPGYQLDATSVSALKQRGISVESYATNAGASMARNQLKQTFSAAVSALVGGILKSSSSYNDVSTASANNTASISNLVDAKKKFGDMGDSFAALIMHSKAYYDVLKEIGASSVSAQTQIAQGVMLSGKLTDILGCPVLISDCTTLTVAATSALPAYYRSLFVVGGGVQIKEEVTVPMNSDLRTDLQNSPIYSLVEYNQELLLKGMSYAGADEPSDATLAATASWTQAATSIKDIAGVALISQ